MTPDQIRELQISQIQQISFKLGLAITREEAEKRYEEAQEMLKVCLWPTMPKDLGISTDSVLTEEMAIDACQQAKAACCDHE